jgi:hypothetical protein
MVLVNLLLSAILILHFYPDGTRSYTSLVTNTLLLGSKLLWAAVICLQSKNNQQGVSLYKTMRINFNIIDANFLEGDGALSSGMLLTPFALLLTASPSQSTRATKTSTPGSMCRRSMRAWRLRRRAT